MAVEIPALLKAIPVTVLAATFGSLLTLTGVFLSSSIALLGVILSNRNNTTRLLHQLAHEAEEKRKDRLNSLRKDVYLRGAEEIAVLGQRLGGLSSVDASSENFGRDLMPFFASAAQIQLISEPETARAVLDLTTLVGEATTNLLAKLLPIQEARSDARTSHAFYQKSQDEVLRAHSEIRAMTESGTVDKARLDALSSTSRVSQESADSFFEQYEAANARQMRALRAYSLALFSALEPISRQQLRVSVAIRDEIGLETDISELEALMEESRLRTFEAVDGLLQLLTERMQEDDARKT